VPSKLLERNPSPFQPLLGLGVEEEGGSGLVD
jgi:hypothetical protein